MSKRFGVRDARSALARIGRRLPRGATLRDLARGMTVELEHRDVTRGDAVLSARIALAHLRERPDYYALIARLERAPRARRNPSRVAYMTVGDDGNGYRSLEVRTEPFSPDGEYDLPAEASLVVVNGNLFVYFHMSKRTFVAIGGEYSRSGNVTWRGARYHGERKAPSAIDLDSTVEHYGPQIDYLLAALGSGIKPLVDSAGRTVGAYRITDWPFEEGA